MEQLNSILCICETDAAPFSSRASTISPDIAVTVEPDITCLELYKRILEQMSVCSIDYTMYPRLVGVTEGSKLRGDVPFTYTSARIISDNK